MAYKKKDIVIVHPTRARVAQAIKTHRLWMGNASNPDAISYVFSVDTDDDTRFLFNSLSDQLYPNTTFCIQANRSAIDAINNAARESTHRIIVVVSDDFSCEPEWDKKLLAHTVGRRCFVVQTNDGYSGAQAPWLITLPIMDRAYFDLFGYVYNPEYRHMWADTEMTAVARMMDKVIDLSSIMTFRHDHYTTGRTQKDAINERNDATWNQGKSLFLERHARNFDIPKPVITFPQSMFT